MKTLPTNKFLRGIQSKDPQIGLWISLCSNIGADVVAPSGFDWVLVDMEHSANDYQSVMSQLQVFDTSKATAIVRPEWNDPVAVKRLLDIGARGLLFPMINSVDEAKQAVAATRYPPHGIRGFSASTRANRYGRTPDYIDRIEHETAVIVQIESKAALAVADDIAAVDGVDGVFFGPADIAADIGLIGQPLNAAVWDVIRPVAKRLIASGVPVGTLVADAQFAAELINDGFNFVACGSDIGLLAKASDALLETVKSKIVET